jgi:nicotinate-nucleotide pyrophosphorylase (carboxylating)
VTPRERVAQFFSRDISLDPALLAERVAQALREDIGAGDLATSALVPGPVPGEAVVVAKGDGVVAGVDVAVACFQQLDESVTTRSACSDGTAVRRGDEVLRVQGDLRSILMAERTALNFLRRMSGTATVTRGVVEAIAHTGVHLLDTRKTVPTLRAFDKYAVRAGGGWSHRDGLYDMCLVKENHIAAAGGLDKALSVLAPLLETQLVEVEVSTVDDALTVAGSGVPLILLDNMALEQMREVADAVARMPEQQRPALEASGNITRDNAADVAGTGVDYFSMGGLTHSVPDLDLSLLASMHDDAHR